MIYYVYSNQGGSLLVSASDSLEIQPTGTINGSIRPPGSKSITNRALICAALARGKTQLIGALDSDDTRVMVAALRQLGLAIDHDQESAIITVDGCGGRIPVNKADLNVEASGTTMRFLTAMLTLGAGKYRLDGVPRMRERPIADLVDSLRQLGATIDYEGNEGCPPLVIHAHGLDGGPVSIRGDISSQFLSGLIMAAPYSKSPVEVNVEGELVSKPYVVMTADVMTAFGVPVQLGKDLANSTIAGSQKYSGNDFQVEPDASAASYFLAAAAITGGCVTVEGLTLGSIQGDVAFADVLEKMGCLIEAAGSAAGITVQGKPLRGIDVDMNAISDTVQTLAAVALFAEGPTTITGVPHIRLKETDRLAALATELRKFGSDVDERPDGLKITPPAALHGAEIETYDDHRMAMSMALVGLKVPGVQLLDPGCTSKTYPRYFQDLAALVAGP